MSDEAPAAPSTRFFELINRPKQDGVPSSPATLRALFQAEKLLVSCWRSNPRIVPTDLLNLRGLFRALNLAGIEGWIPVTKMPLQGYVSWLGMWKKNAKMPAIALDQSAYGGMIDGALGTRRAQTVILAIMGHEAGHEVMRDPASKRHFVTDMGQWLAADPAELIDEAEAWLLAAFLMGFVFADLGSAKRPDETSSYL